MNFTTHHNTPPDSFSAAPPKDSTQIDFQAMFLLLPQSVERSLRQQGFSTPIPSLDTAWYMQTLDRRFDAKLMKVSPTPGKSTDLIRLKIQESLKRRSTKSLAVHLYITELLKLIEMLATSQASTRGHALKVA